MSLESLFDDDDDQVVVLPFKQEEPSDFKILSDKEHLLLRPSMYIGSVVPEDQETWVLGKYEKRMFVSGLIKIINEIIDNSVDCYLRDQGANHISVNIVENQITVQDNGHGIPQENVILLDGKSVPRPVACWTQMKAGTSFSDDRKTIGANGVGSVCANVFSVMFKGETCDGTNMMTVECRNNIDTLSVTNRPHKKRGTTVMMVPDLKRFGISKIDQNVHDIIHDRLQSLAVCYPGIRFLFNGQRMTNKFADYAKMYANEYIVHESPNFSFFITTDDNGFKQNSFVNGVNTFMGGSHVGYIFDQVSDHLALMIKKRHKLDVAKSRIRECFTMVLFVREFVDPRFSSQTKERLTSPYGDIAEHLGECDFKKIASRIFKNENLIMVIIENALARKLAAEKATATKAAKKAKKARVAKHIKANGLDDMTTETTLFLVEGDSAAGLLVKCRDSNTQGGYPLRGKVLNTWNLGPAEILKNKELFELCSILNVIPGSDSSEMTYDNIAIMCDSDVDGGNIATLLIAFFYKYWPELFVQNRIKIVRTPIIIADNGKKADWFYTIDDYESSKPSYKHETRYIKGLGSLEENEYERCLKQPVYDIITINEESKAELQMLFGDDSSPRKLWLKD